MLDRVILSSSAHESLLFHSLTSESEEIMGLLIGEAVEDGESNVVTFFAVEPLARIDKRPDRVEISPEDMVKSRNAAEEMSLVETGTRDRLRVLGWYHSHPHLTVHPSNVDLRTQCGMQMLDKNFVGIIMAAFNKRRDEAKILVNYVQMTCFQSTQNASGFKCVDVPFSIVPRLTPNMSNASRVANVADLLLSEEQTALQDANEGHYGTRTAEKNRLVFQCRTLDILSYVTDPMECLYEAEKICLQQEIKMLEPPKIRKGLCNTSI